MKTRIVLASFLMACAAAHATPSNSAMKTSDASLVASRFNLDDTANNLALQASFLKAMIEFGDRKASSVLTLLLACTPSVRAVHEAQYGRNNDVAAVLSSIKIAYPTKATDGSVDMGPTILMLADRIHANKDPFTQERIAEEFDAAIILPLMRGGSEPIKAALAKASIR